MKIIFLLLLLALCNRFIFAQNVDYNMRITRFFGSNCGGEPGNEEHTWKGWTRDNLSTAETYSGCRQINRNGSATLTGSFAARSRTNTTANTLYARIDAWEDDNGSRCQFRTGFWVNDDDCHAERTCNYSITNPVEYQWTSRTSNCGTGDYNMDVFYQYRYTTTSLSAATEYTATSLSPGGTRPFWGSRGSWGYVGSDCATSGTIGNNQTSSFSTTVSCKRQVTFRWRVSSETNYDWLEIWVNGTRRDRISGNTAWATRTINLDVGSNVVEWRYTKDGSISSNLDRGFVDQISFLDANSVVAGSISGNQTLCAGGNPSLLNSTANAQGYSNTLNYQWQRSTNGTTWSNISSATAATYDPPATSQRYFYRRRVQDQCGNTNYTNTLTVNINPRPIGSLQAPPSSICPGDNAVITFVGNVGTGPYNITYGGSSINGINSGSTFNVAPTATANYQLTALTDANGCVANSAGLGSAITVVVNTPSTAPTIAAVNGMQCPNTTVALTASGGTPGTGSTVHWYTGPNGTGTAIGTGNTIAVAPNTTTRYYARREGLCNNTNDDDEEISIRDFAYAALGATASTGYCTDNSGWNHFYNASGEIVFSLQGDLTGATSTPTVTITNNGTHYQRTVGAVGICTNGWSAGEEQFELPRSWNVDFNGTLNPPYTVRYYHPSNERTNLESAAQAYIAANPACGYTYKYPSPNGFFWFKNVGSAYTPPLFDQPTKLVGSGTGNANGVHYTEIPGITSFSGGSGGIVLVSDPSLPVELTSFDAWNEGATNSLRWVTQTELNNDRFEIERSADGQSFETIAVVKGAGNSLTELTYFAEDKAPLMGVNYYRLRQVDTDGTTSYSNIVAVEVSSQMGEARFFPNPTTGRLTYQFNAEQEETLTLEVTDVLGRTVGEWMHQTQIGINTKVLDLTSLTAGTYQVTVSNQQGVILQTQRIVKSMP